jgi:hypothetical protein
MKTATDLEAIAAEMAAGCGTLPPSDKVLALRELLARRLPRRLHKRAANTITRGGK